MPLVEFAGILAAATAVVGRAATFAATALSR